MVISDIGLENNNTTDFHEVRMPSFIHGRPPQQTRVDVHTRHFLETRLQETELDAATATPDNLVHVQAEQLVVHASGERIDETRHTCETLLVRLENLGAVHRSEITGRQLPGEDVEDAAGALGNTGEIDVHCEFLWHKTRTDDVRREDDGALIKMARCQHVDFLAEERFRGDSLDAGLDGTQELLLLEEAGRGELVEQLDADLFSAVLGRGARQFDLGDKAAELVVDYRLGAPDELPRPVESAGLEEEHRKRADVERETGAAADEAAPHARPVCRDIRWIARPGTRSAWPLENRVVSHWRGTQAAGASCVGTAVGPPHWRHGTALSRPSRSTHQFRHRDPFLRQGETL